MLLFFRRPYYVTAGEEFKQQLLSFDQITELDVIKHKIWKLTRSVCRVLYQYP